MPTGTPLYPGQVAQITVPVSLNAPPAPVPDPNGGSAYPVPLVLTVTIDPENIDMDNATVVSIAAVATHCPVAPNPQPTTAPGSSGRGSGFGSQTASSQQIPVPGSSGTGSGFGSQTASSQQIPFAYAPSDVHQAASVAECQQHHGNFFCGALQGAAANFLVLVWRGDASAGAYHVYRTDGNRRILVATGAQAFEGAVPTAQGLEGVQAGSCFAVSETRSNLESGLSTPFCFGTNVPATVTLSPTKVSSSDESTSTLTRHSGGTCNSSGSSEQRNATIDVGYLHTTIQGSFCDYAMNEVFRAGLLFDAGTLGGRHIGKAILTLHVDSAQVSGVHAAQQTNHTTSCATIAGAGTAAWWNYNDRPAIGSYSAPADALSSSSSTITIDVTTIVRAWAGGLENFGFVLRGDNEDLSAFTETACHTRYVSPSLTVSFQ